MSLESIDVTLFSQPLAPLTETVPQNIAGVDSVLPADAEWDPQRRRVERIDWDLVVELRGRASSEIADRCA